MMEMWRLKRHVCPNFAIRYSNFAIRILLCLGLVGCTSWLAATVSATQAIQSVTFAGAQEHPVEIPVYLNRSAMIRFDQPLARVSLADPSLVEAVLISPTELLLNGKKVGSSSMIAWNTSEPDRPVAFMVKVIADIRPIVAQIASLFPDEALQVEQVDGRAIVTGTVSSQQVIDAIMPLFEGSGLRAINLTQMAGKGAPTQVMLQVRVAEVNRRLLRELGANFSFFNPRNPRGQNEAVVGPNTFSPPGSNFVSGGPSFSFSDMVNLFVFNPDANIGTFIRALKERNAFRLLAEPNIIAVDGQEASFLAGGEFPFPVVQPSGGGVTITIQFREFGVRLKFKPTVVDGGRIRLQLAPEVSALDFVNALQLQGFLIPGLRERKASTTVELADGQSFALAGLLSNDLTKVNSKIPLLGDIPILGYLFRSQSYIKNETELVFLCTARLVKPLEPNEVPPLPGVESPEGTQGLEGTFGPQVPPVSPQGAESKPDS